MCGVFGITGHPQAKQFLPVVLRSLQHRGHDAAGIAGVVNESPNSIDTAKGMGKVSSIINPASLEKFIGTRFIGHTRYSTRNGVTSHREIHPHWAQSMRGRMVIVTNGDLINVKELLSEVKNRNVKVYTENDAELLAALINIQIRKNGKRVVQAIKETMKQAKGGFAALFMMEDDDRIFAFRDPWGIRPLNIAEFNIEGNKSVAISSETCTFDIIQRFNSANYPDQNISYSQRTLKPGEIIAVDSKGNIESTQFFDSPPENIGCVFESIYFSRPDSMLEGESFQTLRERMGAELFKESPIDADLVAAVPKGGIPSAVGFARASGLPYGIAILEEPSIEGVRSFTTDKKNRSSLAIMKYNILPDVVRDKRLVIIDDSIVRGTTTRLLVGNLFKAGAKEIHLRIPCPPYSYPCHYGIETKDPESLISHSRTESEIAKELGATSLAYLSLSGLYKAIGKKASLFCDECLSNQSPIHN